MLRTIDATRPCRWAVALVVAATLGAACSDGGGTAVADDPTTTSLRSTTSVAVGPTSTEEPAVDLAGTSWRLESLVDGDGERSGASGDVPAVISFDADELEGYDGVDTATGTYELDGDELRIDLDEISDLGPSRTPGIEQLLFPLLVGSDRVELDDGDLVLHHDDGELRFEPVGGGTAG